jgi:membrane protease YdiL (CAAX protease family)
VMFTGLARSWGTAVAGIVTTLLFLAVHLLEAGLYFPALAAIASMGVAALWLRIRTRSLAPAVALHVGYNAVIIGSVLASFV